MVFAVPGDELVEVEASNDQSEKLSAVEPEAGLGCKARRKSQHFTLEEKMNQMDCAEGKGYVNYRWVLSWDVPPEAEPICAMKYNNYKVHSTIGLSFKNTPVLRAVLDKSPAPTWSIPNFFHKDSNIA